MVQGEKHAMRTNWLAYSDDKLKVSFRETNRAAISIFFFFWFWKWLPISVHFEVLQTLWKEDLNLQKTLIYSFFQRAGGAGDVVCMFWFCFAFSQLFTECFRLIKNRGTRNAILNWKRTHLHEADYIAKYLVD